MAWSEIETKIANPASGHSTKRKGKKKNMARKLSAKQIKFFGTKRQKSALKLKRKKKKNSAHSRPMPFFRSKKKLSAKKHRSNPAPKKRRKLKLSVKRKSSRKRKSAKRRNPVPEIISLVMGNPARKKGKKKAMAKSKKRASSKKSNAGTRRKKSFVKKGRRRSSNPGSIGRPMDWIKGGVGVIAGGVGTRILPQFAGASNTGAMGYAMNAGAAIALTFAAHAFIKDKVITASVAAGGFAALILRVVGDQTPYGQALSLSGFGDYMVSNFVTPQRIVNQGAAMFEVPNGWGMTPAVAGALPGGSGADSPTSGNSY